MGFGSRQVTGRNVSSTHSIWYVSAMEHMVGVVQELSCARDLPSIMKIVRHAARDLTGADGATFVLRDNEQCYYADEDAISPLWKGLRFPINMCISGWVMQHAQPVTIENIYKDPRIPHDAYRPTFVKSLCMVPIRRESPIGAIGTYWAQFQAPSDEIVAVLQALADTTSVAMENVRLYEQLQAQLKALQESNHELSRFAWIAGNSLEDPLRSIVAHITLLEKHYARQLDARGSEALADAAREATTLQKLTDELMVHAHVEKVKNFRPLGIDAIFDRVLAEMAHSIKGAQASIEREPLPWIWGDPVLIERLLHNILTNALTFVPPGTRPQVHVSAEQKDERWRIRIRDNGIGVPAGECERIFGMFQRLHTQDQYPGVGLGLATCKKVVEMHGGAIWMEPNADGPGSTVHITLPVPDQVNAML